MRNRPSLKGLQNIEDLLLADVAVRIQLSPTNYNKAEERYKAISAYVERDGSPLQGRVLHFYPQGSVPIGATIASRLTTDEYDVDIVAQLLLDENSDPAAVLDLLYEAIRGEAGSRYHEITIRQSRCVTVNYADGMHVDYTPMVRRPFTAERESVLFHHCRETPHILGYSKIANPFGFAQWFKRRTPQEVVFSNDYAALMKSQMTLDEAQQDPIPEQEHLTRKSMAVIVLQLIKRFRNVRYDRRKGRRPPSVKLSKLVADNAGHTTRLSDELLYQARQIFALLAASASIGQRVHIANPVCPQDVFTDRWPADLDDQVLFMRDLEHLIRQVERLRSGCPLSEMQEILTDLFGERPSADAVRDLADTLGDRIRTGHSLYVPSSALAGGSAGIIGLTGNAFAEVRQTPPHRFFGDGT
jgi:hypothetical protein